MEEANKQKEELKAVLKEEAKRQKEEAKRQKEELDMAVMNLEDKLKGQTAIADKAKGDSNSKEDFIRELIKDKDNQKKDIKDLNKKLDQDTKKIKDLENKLIKLGEKNKELNVKIE